MTPLKQQISLIPFSIKKGDNTIILLQQWTFRRLAAKYYHMSPLQKNRFCRAMLCISATYTVTRCLSVRLSVTFVSCVKTNKDIFEIISPLGSQAIVVFPRQTGWRHSDGNPPNGGVECRWGRQKTRFWTSI